LWGLGEEMGHPVVVVRSDVGYPVCGRMRCGEVPAAGEGGGEPGLYADGIAWLKKVSDAGEQGAPGEDAEGDGWGGWFVAGLRKAIQSLRPQGLHSGLRQSGAHSCRFAP